MANFLWLLLAVAYSSAGVTDAQLRATAQPAPSGPQQYLSRLPTPNMAATAPSPSDGMGQDPAGAYPKTAGASQPLPSQDPSSTQAPYSPNNRTLMPNPPPQTATMSSPQVMTPPLPMTPPQTKPPAMDPSASLQRNKQADASPAVTPTQPASSMKQAPTASSIISQVASAMSPMTPDQIIGQQLNATTAALNKKPASFAPNNQTSQPPKTPPASANMPVPNAANRTAKQGMPNQPIPATPNAKAALNDQALPPQMNSPPSDIPPNAATPPTNAPMPPAPNVTEPVHVMSMAPPAAIKMDAKNNYPAASLLPVEGMMDGFVGTAPPDPVQLIATEKFNTAIDTNPQNEQKAQELITQLKAASKMKLSSHQLGNQTIFLNSLTPEQRIILESKMKSLTLTPTQVQLERNYLATFVSANDKMAHQAGFEAIKKTLTPEAQRAFDPSEGMKSLELTDDQKYMYEEGSREYLEDPGARNQSGAAQKSGHRGRLLVSLLLTCLLIGSV
ncbi:hypothetical protein PCANC_26803 [Puccinia coronata f. sp. avenae]|uniref:Uncharacterized protein n=1 Tax=Puccinia coronata f. sp. avenae TaxID=200324 RepID=A0A2N5RXZ2_9BASI|nr:hypothetical protein PCANC_26803 [Puccinia coronata f. sp. avenae]